MPTLRSRDISSPPPPPQSSKPSPRKTLTTPPPPPPPLPPPALAVSDNPTETLSPSHSRRRSVRLSSRSSPLEDAAVVGTPNSGRKRSSRRGEVKEESMGKRSRGFDLNVVEIESDGGNEEVGLGIRDDGDGGGGVVLDDKGKGILIYGEEKDENDQVIDSSNRGERKYTREEKGKGKIVYDDDDDEGDDDLLLGNGQWGEFGIDLNVPAGAGDYDFDDDNDDHDDVDAGMDLEEEDVAMDEQMVYEASVENAIIEAALGHPVQNDDYLGRVRRKRGMFKETAKRNADKLAKCTSENEKPLGVEKIEDAGGAFLAAKKTIEERGTKVKRQETMYSVGRDGAVSVKWTPRGREEEDGRPVPLLQDLCLSVLAKNADAMTSLQYVPDVIRHKLSEMLCHSRKMTVQFFNLLLQGSPSEIRLTDCSWMTEEEFQQSFEGCDTDNLTVLQLDLCGRCLPDYILTATLARKRLPMLTAISLRGSYRLTDAGLSALVSAAPVLRSVNLSDSALLTAVGISSMADSLSSLLTELYIDGCESIDVLLLLPSLKKLKHLKVLSLAGIPSVSDHFIKELVTANGHQLKELNLGRCVNLTDSSMVAIAENCPRLCTLDIAMVCHLTDVAIGHLANGLKEIQTLRLLRHNFSDEAVAAFLETRGEILKELSLHCVTQVSHHTAISLSKRCRKLEKLNLSFCRSLTEEALGLIADSCLSLRILDLFGCTQVTETFINGYSNPNLKVIGLKMTPVAEDLKEPRPQLAPLRYG